MEIFFQGTVYLGVDFFLIKGMLCLFFMLAIQIWNITDNLFDIFFVSATVSFSVAFMI